MLLHAVVQVALDRAAVGIGCQHEPPPGRAQLLDCLQPSTILVPIGVVRHAARVKWPTARAPGGQPPAYSPAGTVVRGGRDFLASIGSTVRRGVPIMRIRLGLAATLSLVVVLALGSSGTSASPSIVTTENAVLYWSGVTAPAIAAGGRAPASSSVLGGIVHGAMYDAVAAIEGGLEPFATGVTAPPGANADAAVAQAARDVMVVRVPGQATTIQTAYDTYMATIPDGPAKEAGKLVGTAAAAGMLAMRYGDHFDDVVPYVQKTPGPGVFEPIAATPPVDPKLALVRPFTYESPSDYRPNGPVDMTSKQYAKDWEETERRSGASTARFGLRSRPRPSGSTPSRRSSSSTAPCGRWRWHTTSTCASRPG